MPKYAQIIRSASVQAVGINFFKTRAISRHYMIDLAHLSSLKYIDSRPAGWLEMYVLGLEMLSRQGIDLDLDPANFVRIRTQ